MYTLFDYNDDVLSAQQLSEIYFGDFTAEVRRQLLAKNLERPENLYDVFYTSTRDTMLSKNVIISSDLDESSKAIRDGLLSKQIPKILGLEDTSEDTRASLLARNKINGDTEKVIQAADDQRRSLLSKNPKKDQDIERDSSRHRIEQLAKSRATAVLGEDNLIKDSEKYKEKQISKNVPKDSDLLADSDDAKDNLLAKNVVFEKTLEQISDDFRDGELAKNVSKDTSLETDSENFRKEQTHKNVSKDTSIESLSETFRKEELSKNVLKEADLQVDSAAFRSAEELQNISKDINLEQSSVSTKNETLAKNIEKNSDLLTDSQRTQKEILGKNTVKETDLLSDSEKSKEGNLSKNKESKNDLEKDSKIFRDNEESLNVPKNSDLENLSKTSRDGNLSQNNSKDSDLEFDSVPFLNQEQALNIPKNQNLETDSKQFRDKEESLNVSKVSDLEDSSKNIRDNVTSLNVPKVSDIESDSESFRNNEMSLNTLKVTDLLSDSEPIKDNVLSQNVPKVTDLLSDSESIKDAELAQNVPSDSDILVDSEPYLTNELAQNVSNDGDLLVDSEPYLTSELAQNVPNDGDLLVDSEPYLTSEQAQNVPSNSDVLTDSETFLSNELAQNVPNNSDLLVDSEPYLTSEQSQNVPNGGDLLVDSQMYLTNELGQNVPNDTNLLTDSQTYLQSEIAQNVPKNTNLLTDSETFKDNNLAKNDSIGLLGTNITANGTATFVGVSTVYTQGLLFRGLQTMSNNYHLSLLGFGSSHEYQDSLTESQLLNDTIKVPSLHDVQQGTSLPMDSDLNSSIRGSKFPAFLSISSPVERNVAMEVMGIDESRITRSIYGSYGEGQSTSFMGTISYNSGSIGYEKTQIEPDSNNISLLMRDYLRYMNPFVIVDGRQTQDNKAKSSVNIKNTLSNLGNTGDAMLKSIGDLLTYYPEAFKDPGKLKFSVTVPKGGNYILGDAETMLDPEYRTPYDENYSTIAQKKIAGNVFDDTGEFRRGEKGVRSIIKRIANDSNVEFAQNFRDVQGPAFGSPKGSAVPKEFVIGKNYDGSLKKARQKFTIKNPYAPEVDTNGTNRMIFYIKNYSISDVGDSVRYFPPYITSFQNGDTANWNTTNFLGRPEPVYTYNNSSRDGSISFFVLTDFAQEVLIGRDQKGSMEMQTTGDRLKNFNFTEHDPQVALAAAEDAKAKAAEYLKQSQEVKEKLGLEKGVMTTGIQKNETNTTDKAANEEINNSTWAEKAQESSDSSSLQSTINSQFNTMVQKAADLATTAGNTPIYSETQKDGTNVYDNILKNVDDGAGYQESVVGDTLERLDDMIKNLRFQPAFFSGSLVDFKNRMEFLARLTRPSRNDNSFVYNDANATIKAPAGFSFIKPPICHLRLGDWIDHDIVVNNVSYSYADAPWTFGAKVVQPMWAEVTIQFNIIGPVGTEDGIPLTSTDKHGFFGSVNNNT